MAERKEIDVLRPIDKVIFGMTASLQAVTKVNAICSLVTLLGVELFADERRQQEETQTGVQDLSLAGCKRQHEDKDTKRQLERPSPPQAETSGEVRLYNLNRERG